jgi:hypothetical protein
MTADPMLILPEDTMVREIMGRHVLGNWLADMPPLCHAPYLLPYATTKMNETEFRAILVAVSRLMGPPIYVEGSTTEHDARKENRRRLTFGELLAAGGSEDRLRVVRDGYASYYDCHVRPLVKRIVRFLLGLRAVSPLWAQGMASVFPMLYKRIALLLSDPYHVLDTPTPELARRHLVLGLWHPTGRLNHEIKLGQRDPQPIRDWKDAFVQLDRLNVILRKPGQGGRADRYVLTLAQERALVNKWRAGQIVQAAPAGRVKASQYWCLQTVHEFPGCETIMPPIAGNRDRWLKAVAAAFAKRDALSQWHEAYVKETNDLKRAESEKPPPRKRARRDAPPPLPHPHPAAIAAAFQGFLFGPLQVAHPGVARPPRQ